MIWIVRNKNTGVESYVTESHYEYLKGKSEFDCEVLGAEAVEPTMRPLSTDYTVKEVQGMASQMSQDELREFIPEGENRKTVLKLLDNG